MEITTIKDMAINKIMENIIKNIKDIMDIKEKVVMTMIDMEKEDIDTDKVIITIMRSWIAVLDAEPALPVSSAAAASDIYLICLFTS